MTPQLRRGADTPAPPVRLLHLGLGNFFRAHQAWYTAHAADAAGWGIAAFSGSSRRLADALTEQGGLYTLVVRAADGDHTEVIGNLVEAHPGDDHEALLRCWRLPDLAVVTLTVTEKGYCRDSGGRLDLANPDVRDDIAALRRDSAAPVRTAPARLLAGLLARAEAGLPGVTVLSCDNLPDNGVVAGLMVQELAGEVDPQLTALVRRTAFATSMVDRITPATTDDDLASVAATTGVRDLAPVVTEPFSEWVISGDFPAGRPDWESAGARLVESVEPFERRKLWLLNGAHSLLAYAGLLKGHQLVSEAVADPELVEAMTRWWDEAAQHLELPDVEIAHYRTSLQTRFANPRIRHLLSQIAADGSDKLPVRVLPTLRAERAAGRSGEGAARVVAAWLRYLRSDPPSLADSRRDAALAASTGPLDEAAASTLRLLDAELASDPELVALVARLAAD
ncbi:mannitol dehydrogenase family protein [Microlunatus panaciterrae]|uniref:Fructuronate reductase n=1 Tax=Microlunatus panaciterrae TaxID=400768 RepID=A0ABS2RP51_9ACTN|nr:mannitol dehydrogenase family protein [Microlunatus panaciterrae]MBM7800352.1 fructuronate reductase [Microlunatus panaciterrae]